MFSNNDRVYVANVRNPYNKHYIGKQGVVINFTGRDELLEIQLDAHAVGDYFYFYQNELARLPQKGDHVRIIDEKDVPHKGQVGVINLVFDTDKDPQEWYYYVKFPQEDRRGVLFHLHEIEVVNQSYTKMRQYAEKYAQFCVFNGILWGESIPTREQVVNSIEGALNIFRFSTGYDVQVFYDSLVIRRKKDADDQYEVSIVLGDFE